MKVINYYEYMKEYFQRVKIIESSLQGFDTIIEYMETRQKKLNPMWNILKLYKPKLLRKQ